MTGTTEGLDEHELLDCNFKCMKCFYGHYSFGKNRICFRCKTEMSSYREIRDAIDKLGKIEIYVRILQDGDPENEDPKKILDYIEQTISTIGDKR